MLHNIEKILLLIYCSFLDRARELQMFKQRRSKLLPFRKVIVNQENKKLPDFLIMLCVSFYVIKEIVHGLTCYMHLWIWSYSLGKLKKHFTLFARAFITHLRMPNHELFLKFRFCKAMVIKEGR